MTDCGTEGIKLDWGAKVGTVGKFGNDGWPVFETPCRGGENARRCAERLACCGGCGGDGEECKDVGICVNPWSGTL